MAPPGIATLPSTWAPAPRSADSSAGGRLWPRSFLRDVVIAMASPDRVRDPGRRRTNRAVLKARRVVSAGRCGLGGTGRSGRRNLVVSMMGHASGSWPMSASPTGAFDDAPRTVAEVLAEQVVSAGGVHRPDDTDTCRHQPRPVTLLFRDPSVARRDQG